MKPNDLILSTDYGTLKNDTSGNSISASITKGQIFNVSSPLLASAILTVGTINAGLRARAKSSKYPPWITGVTLYSDMKYSIPSMPGSGISTGTLYCNIQRISPTTIKLNVATEGGFGAPNFKIEENQTITFVFSTFLSPFN